MSPATTPLGCSREYACCAGLSAPDVAWILSPWGFWAANPYYLGPPVPHPAVALNLDQHVEVLS